MTKLILTLTHSASTKNCERYEASAEEATKAKLRTQTLYIEKSAFSGLQAPKKVTLEVIYE